MKQRNVMWHFLKMHKIQLSFLAKFIAVWFVKLFVIKRGAGMEKWDLYTKYREKTGKEHIRGEKLPDGLFHLVVHIWIRNSKGEYLISKRAADRPTYPLIWESAGGSVIKGEDSLEGAIREVKEEVGIDLQKEDGKLVFSKIRGKIDGKKFNDIMDVWLFEYDGEPSLENASTAEVAECRWALPEEIKHMYKKGEFVETLDYFFSAFKEYTPDYSSITGKMVSGRIDRPIGSQHPRHKEMVYPVNYGYVDGVFAGDGAEQDVYVFGTDKPLDTYKGKVIAVFHRFNDVEDKWIVSLDGSDIPDEKILGDIYFQEQFFYGKLYR